MFSLNFHHANIQILYLGKLSYLIEISDINIILYKQCDHEWSRQEKNLYYKFYEEIIHYAKLIGLRG